MISLGGMRHRLVEKFRHAALCSEIQQEDKI